MDTIFKAKRSTVAGKAPADGTLETGELAVNVVDGKIFTGDAAKKTVELGGGSSSSDTITSTANTTAKELRISEMVSLTESDYEALSSKQADKLYMVKGSSATSQGRIYLGDFLVSGSPVPLAFEVNVWAPSEADAQPSIHEDHTSTTQPIVSTNNGNGSWNIKGEGIVKLSWMANAKITKIECIDMTSIKVWGAAAYSMFAQTSNLTTIVFAPGSVKHVKDLSNAFTSSGLTSLDLSEFTSVTSLSGMCDSAADIVWIDLKGIKNIINPYDIFSGCPSLKCIKNIDTTSWSIQASSSGWFENCPALTNPSSAEQTQLVTPPGLNYVNANPCP